MIDRAISHIAMQLNEYLRGSLNVSEDLVVMSNLLDANGTPAPNLNNRIVLFLTSVERDTASHRANEGGGQILSGNKPLFLNIYVMLAANFTGANYPEALKFLSLAISFFHRRPVFDHAISPDLDSGINKLILDLENTSPQAMSNIWGVLGGRYLPSVLYRVRMIEVGAPGVESRTPRITAPQPQVAARPGDTR